MAVRKYIYSFILLALISFKVSAFHVYEHQEDHSQANDCELCEYAVYNQNLEFSVETEIQVPTKMPLLLIVFPAKSIEAPMVSRFVFEHPFTRPPPTV